VAKRRSSSSSASRNGTQNSKSKRGVPDESLYREIENIPLRMAAQDRYLNYSLSVITSRALPDVRDGLKPVQRRILYTMFQQRLDSTAKHRKCAKVVGDVMGNYHPHGDSSIYEALVRMSQPFSLRMPMIDGSGNFGSIDGDNAAAMRYTECRMMPIASEVLADLATRTVAFKPSYDGTREEPVVLPSRVPNMLVNGATGIAVGMATNIPPHNLKEVCNALLKLLRDPEIKDYQLVAADAIQGPDFPTGGLIVNTKDELREIYATGSGTIKLRGVGEIAETSKTGDILRITEIPFGVNKATMVEQITELVYSNKLPLVEEVRDLSSEDIRVDLLLKKNADPEKVLAFLYKHTPLQTNFNVNLTCLTPTENPEVGSPRRLSLKEILWYFLKFRFDVLTARLTNELNSLLRRIHILEGFAIVFDALDTIIKIIRASDGKADAADKIMQKFPADKGGLDAEQTDAILELKLYRLARLEINVILDELKAKRKRVKEIEKLLADDHEDFASSGRWNIIRDELTTLVTQYGSDTLARRRSKILVPTEEVEYTEEDFIVAENCHILVTVDGWVKRQKLIADPAKSRLRQGDRVLACVAGNTRETIAFFSSIGVCYTARMQDIPASTGFGEPIQKLFKFKDGERIVAALSLDPRIIGNTSEDPKGAYFPETHALAASSDGYALRFGLQGFTEPSTRAGRRYARVKPGASIVDVVPIHGSETVLAVSADARAMVCPVDEINYLSGAGKGVLLIKLATTDRLLGFKPSVGDRDLLTVVTNRGAKKTISTTKYRTTSRGGRGIELQKNGKISEIVAAPIEPPKNFDE
jgi:DNA gyrase subunit A